MLDRFTGDARQVVVAAQQAAREVGTGSIGPGELLVALLEHAGDADVTEPLAALGAAPVGLAAAVRQAISRDGTPDEDAPGAGVRGAVRQVVAALLGTGSAAARRPARGHVPFTPAAKAVLERALVEADRSDSHAIHVRHLMLGLLDHPDSTARGLLAGALGAVGRTGDADADRRVAAVVESLRRSRPAS